MRSLIAFGSLLVIVAMVNAEICPIEEAFPHNGNLYQIFECPLPWKKAEDKCKNEMIVNGTAINGGHLVSILDDKEKDWFKFVLETRFGSGSPVGIWIGGRRRSHHLHRRHCPERFLWSDGSKLDYKNFNSNQTDCAWPHERCFALIDNDQWIDAECQLPMRFVCKAKQA